MTALNILAAEQLDAIRKAFVGSSVIVEHRFLGAARAPDSFVFDDFEDFKEYLNSKASPGDGFWFWRYNDLCRAENAVAYGKYPNYDDQVFGGGAY
jgi:hypothetical protein